VAGAEKITETIDAIAIVMNMFRMRWAQRGTLFFKKKACHSEHWTITPPKKRAG
jgi:hypothetical protein